MRQALLAQLPALTAFYGLRPWELDDMTEEELDEYTRQLAEHQADVERRAKGGA